MERLTNKEELKRIELSTRINTKYFKSYFLYSQLFEYENTGLEPSEIEKLKHDLEVYKIVADKSYEAMSNMRLLIADNVIRDNYFVSKEKLIEQAEKELKGENNDD